MIFFCLLFEFVDSFGKQQGFPNESLGYGSERWKFNAMNRLLRLKWCQIDREVTPFQVLSVGVNLWRAHFGLKDSKLQYNSSLNASDHKRTYWRRFAKSVLWLSLCLQLLLGSWWALLVGLVVRRNILRSTFVFPSWFICRYQLNFLLSNWPPFIKSNGTLLILHHLKTLLHPP